MQNIEMNSLLETAIHASIEAGNKVMEIYRKDFEVEFKEDESPLTIADTAANEVINTHLEKFGIPILSEEGKSIPYEERKDWTRFWIVDPLDGTKEFIKRNGEFTINIALVEDGIPVMGVIYIPVQHTLYFASAQTHSLKVASIGNDLSTASLDTYIGRSESLPVESHKTIYTIVGSKSHLTPETRDYIEELKKEHGDVEVFSRGSSLKICMVAEGEADIYPRFAPTMEWDIAAGHAIAKFAGARIIHAVSGEELTYNSEGLVNPWFIVRR